MTDSKFQEFQIYGIDPSGLNYTLDSGFRDPIAAQGRTLLPGQTLTITEGLRAVNTDRNGVSWFDYSDDDQLRHWGALRFGVGEVSEVVKARIDRERREQLTQERDFLLRANPRLAKSSAGSLRLGELDAELGNG